VKQRREMPQLVSGSCWCNILCVLYFVCMFGIGNISAQQPAQQPQANTQHDTGFPDGPGKDALLKTCSKCHSPNVVMANRQDREGWENTITKMVSLGAVGTDEDFTAILDYLVKNFPQQSKINVNKATVTELQTGLSLSQKEAEAVVAYRDKNGDFKSFDDLKKVPLLDAKKIDEKRDRVTFQ
jgi:competence protein ComEA